MTQQAKVMPESTSSNPTCLSPREYMDLKHRIHRELLDRLDRDWLAELEAPRVRSEIRGVVATLVEEERSDLGAWSRELVVDQVLNEVFGLGPLEPLMEDPTITDILVTTHDRVYVERGGKLVKTPVRFKDTAHLKRIIQKIVAQVGRRVDESSPMVDARLPDGSRVNAVLPPIAVDGPLLSIRRFAKRPLTADDLVRKGSLSADMRDLLIACVRARLNILITGGAGSGKTTLLNVLSAFIPADERIVTIEDTAELQLRQDHVARMETRPPNIEGQGRVKQRELVINSLRMRPDRIIVGEVRGEEALDMLQAMNTGNYGSLATIHANSCREGLRRLEVMTGLVNPSMTTHSIRQQISSAIDLCVHVSRLSDGTRRVVEIADSSEMKDGEASLRELVVFEKLRGLSQGPLEGRFRATAHLEQFFERLGRRNEHIPEDVPPENLHPNETAPEAT